MACNSRKSAGGTNAINDGSDPFGVPVNYSSEPACTPAGPPPCGTLPSLKHLCLL